MKRSKKSKHTLVIMVLVMSAMARIPFHPRFHGYPTSPPLPEVFVAILKEILITCLVTRDCPGLVDGILTSAFPVVPAGILVRFSCFLFVLCHQHVVNKIYIVFKL